MHGHVAFGEFERQGDWIIGIDPIAIACRHSTGWWPTERERVRATAVRPGAMPGPRDDRRPRRLVIRVVAD